ncbi:choice-of-anchor L domain-containing protein, partial [Flavobacterium sp. D11R37]|uniref:choice-of-anchor L domain-containing protein n=1 Tax=Flavobacterium coralii TaxID=2838017 RepID=UPI001CA73B23
VLITTNTANAGVFADYTLLEEWTELEINPVQTVYNEVVVPIPASFVGQNVRIAFVMAGDNGDRWLVDNVSVVSQCIDPSNLGANSFGLTTANLTWTNNSGATSWEIEILPAAAIPTETGVVYNGAPPYPATGLTQDTDYKFYVRALCADGGTSEWVGPFFFSTVALGATCNAPIEIATLPYSTTNNTSNFGDDYSGSPGASGCGSTAAYLNGDDVVYSYTAPANGNISINVTNNGTYSGVFVYTSCANIGVNCAAGAVAGFTAVPLSIPTFAVTAGQTYYVVISTWATPQTTPYTLTIQQVNCAPPVGLPTTGIGQTSAQLSWTNPSGATSWQVVVQAPGAGIPAGAGTTATTNTNYLAGGLTPATPYEYYVRADCGNGTFSAWAGPYLFNTSICDVADQCNFTFVMTDSFGDGWNGNTMTISQNGIPVATIGSTFTTGVGPVSVTVPLCDGLPFQLYWNAGGSFAGEVGVSVVNSFNQTIYTKAPGTGVQNSLLYTTTVDCDTPACLPPTGLSVSQISTDQVDLEWDGPATGDWEYVVVPAGDPAPADSDTGIATTTNPATATGLTAATNYEFYVRINCVGGTTSTWAGPFAFTTAVCELANQCVYDFVMTDSFGDGWNGNTMTISQNGATVAVIGPSFTTGLGPVTVSVALCNNEPLELFWNAGGAFAGEVGVSIVNNFDQTIYTKAPGTGVQNSSLYTTTVDCNNPACLPPGSLTATNITTTEADLGWGGPATGNWEYVIVPQGDPAPTDTTPGVATTTNPAEVSGLTPSTAYSFYIRLICDGGTPSAWAGPYNFNTQCTAFDVPFYEGFNSDSDTEFCWTVNNQNGDNDTWNMNYQFNTFEGNQVAVINTDFNNGNNNDWLISPAINLTGNQRLKFHQRVQSSFEPNDFEVLVSTTGTNPADFTIPLIPLASYDNTGYVEYIVNLEDAGTLITGPVHIAWHVPNGGLDGWILYIDNVIVEDIPPCPEVTDLAVANITQTSAELSWEAGSDETQWEVWVLPIGSPEPTEPGTVVTENPYTATDLEPGTPYVFYVRANCGDVDGDSVISNPETFVTALVNDDCDGAVDVPVNPDAECDEFVSGSMTGATGSGVTQTCITWTDIEYDVWYSFVAEANTHSVTVNNITGGLFLQQILFEGDDCGNLTQLSCGDTSEVYTGLVPGNTYYVMVYTTFFNDPSAITSFDICIKTPVPPISVSADQYTMEELVQEVLIGSDCALVSNVTSSQGSDFGGEASIGYFDQNGSTFPFENGIVMATGGISEAPGPNPGNATFDPFGWPGDADLSAIIAEGGNTGALNNASVLEFDFVPFSDEISFDFLFASSEYGTFQCFFSDAFAFILTGPTTDLMGDNLAVIPGTTIPVSVVNIRDTQYNTGCASANVEYFGQYNPNNPEASAIGYNGQTVVMQASASVIAGETYHIKLVIADYSDAAVNSAVFLGGGSFNIGEPEFGTDLVIEDGNAVCAGGQVLLDTEMDPDTYDFIWYQNEEVIDGETGPSYEVTEAGTYKVEVYYENTDCFVDEEIVVEFYDPIEDITGVPDDLTACDATGFATFDLTENDAAVLEGLENPDDYAVTYHATAEDAENGVSPIGPEYTNTTQFQQTVYVRIENTVSGCYGVKEFDLIIQDLTPEFDMTEDFTICDGGTGTITVTPTNFDGTQVTYTWTLDGDPIAANTATITVTEAGIYEVTIDNTGCEATGSVTVTVAPTPVPDAPADVTACDSYTLPALTVGNYYTATGGQGDMLAAGDVITATQTLYVYAVSDTNPDCTAENSFVVTIN